VTIEEAQEVCRKSLMPVRVAFCREDEPVLYGYIHQVGTAYNYDHGNRIIWGKFDQELNLNGWTPAVAIPCSEKCPTFV